MRGKAPRQRFIDVTDVGSIKSITVTEAVSSILVPLPYVLASLSFGALLTSRLSQSKKNGFDEAAPLISQARQEWPLLCTLTSVTLVAVGLKGKIWQPPASLDRRKKSLGGIDEMEKIIWGDIARRISGRILSVGLPFYATYRLGATRVSLVMLLGLASNIIAIDNEVTDLTKAQGWKRLLSHRQWTLSSIVLQLFCDLSGLISKSGAVNLWLGYTALALSILVLPPSFPSSRPKFSVSTSSAPASESKASAAISAPWETPRKDGLRSPQTHMLSPMTSSPQDVNLTLWSGLVLLAFSIIANLLFIDSEALSLNHLSWNILPGFAAAVVMTVTEPKSLRSNKGLGLVLGSLTSNLILTLLGGASWSSFTYQGIFVGISFVALKYDIHRAFSLNSHSNHQHRHQPPKVQITEHGQMSRFSATLIKNIPQWPLLHSILVEKDSRRIFYFMWSVCKISLGLHKY